MGQRRAEQRTAGTGDGGEARFAGSQGRAGIISIARPPALRRLLAEGTVVWYKNREPQNVGA